MALGGDYLAGIALGPGSRLEHRERFTSRRPSASRQFGRPSCRDGARTEGLLDLKGGPTAMPVIARTARHISAYSYRLTGTYGLAHHRDRDRHQPGAAAGTGLAAPPPDRAPITGCGPERTAT